MGLIQKKMRCNRNSTIVTNFFYYLNTLDISQVKYELDNNLPKGIVSKWKSNKVSIGIEQIYQAAKYFSVTPNDIFYSNEEKLQISILNRDEYEAIEVEKIQEVKVVFPTIKKAYIQIIVFSIISVILFFSSFLSPFFIFYPIFVPFLASSCSASIYIFSPKRSFSIHYLDNIRFIMKNTNNNYYLVLRFMKFITILLFLTVIILNIFYSSIYKNNDDLSYKFFMVYSVTSLFYFGYSIFSFLKVPKQFNKMYDEHSDPFKRTLYFVCINSINFSFTLMFFIINNGPLLLVFSTIILLLSVVELILIGKKMLSYRYMCEKQNGDVVELYPN
ncbi:MAG: hypothetical protein R3Y13_05690 [bacterium]